ncbi:MAG: N-6 DNA methylase [Gammaproteobacteria bacterium]|nr:N-6 DNA methylase [Gammaproteobacteria bacterium]MYF53612.1 N-6 DNA methylase [Gammaproteobacteria bacterium]MYK43464.1 N-6 DNA methylase [Gammaproteobacteria bacterium]
MTPTLIESTFNQGLGEALRNSRPIWRTKGESILVEMTGVLQEGQSLRPDLIVTDRDIQPVIIETSFHAGDADKDAIARLGCVFKVNGSKLLSSIAVHIDQDFRSMNSVKEVTEKLLGGCHLSYSLHQLVKTDRKTETRRYPKSGFIKGTIFDLLSMVQSEALPKERVELVAEYVATKIRQAAQRVESSIDSAWFNELATVVHQRSHLSALRTAMVLWLNAIIVHLQLDRMQHPVTKQISLLGSTTIQPANVHGAWNDILKDNWYSVFQPAVNVLHQYMNMDVKATSEALELLIDAAQRIETSRVGPHMNIGAELFPKLSDDRKESAAFYTQPSTAELLAGLTIRESDVSSQEWGDPHFFSKHSIADLACGTGTLLRAGYQRIYRFHEHHISSEFEDVSLHRDAMEHGLVGADISPIAAHLTTSSLALMDLGQKYSKTRVGWLHVGGANAVTGSLEYLQTNQATDLFDQIGGTSTGAVDSERDEALEVTDASIDWVLMNPPYSRTRSGQSAFDVSGLSEQKRNACQKRWQKLTKNEPVNNKAGMAASFVAIAKKKVKPGGRIGFVLPLTAAFAPSWAPTREMILAEFHDIIAVAVTGGKALGKKALSADTGMEEMLLIATRNRNSIQKTKEFSYVTLREPLSSIGQARETARAVLSTHLQHGQIGKWYPIKVGKDEVGLLLVEKAPTTNAPWSPLSVLNPYLAEAALKLTEGILQWKQKQFKLPIPMTTLSQLFVVGPTHHLIGHISGKTPIGAFEMHEMHFEDSVANPDLSLWHANSKTQKQMLVTPTHKGVSVTFEDRSELEATMRRSMSQLLYARNMRWTSQAILAAATEYPALGGSSWTTLKSNRDELYWPFLLWANSTLGMIVHWTQGQRTHAGRSTTQIGAIKAIPSPDFSKLDENALRFAHQTASTLLQKSLQPACQAHCDPIRKEIDFAVVKMLQLPEQVIAAIEDLRLLWSKEGSVHGQNKRALELLAEDG